MNKYGDNHQDIPDQPLDPELSDFCVVVYSYSVDNLLFVEPTQFNQLAPRACKTESHKAQHHHNAVQDSYSPQSEYAAGKLGFALLAVYRVTFDMRVFCLPALHIERQTEYCVQSESDERKQQPYDEFTYKLRAVAVEFQLPAVYESMAFQPFFLGAHQERIRNAQRYRRKQHHTDIYKQPRQRSARILGFVSVFRFGRKILLFRHGGRRCAARKSPRFLQLRAAGVAELGVRQILRAAGRANLYAGKRRSAYVAEFRPRDVHRSAYAANGTVLRGSGRTLLLFGPGLERRILHGIGFLGFRLSVPGKSAVDVHSLVHISLPFFVFQHAAQYALSAAKTTTSFHIY